MFPLAPPPPSEHNYQPPSSDEKKNDDNKDDNDEHLTEKQKKNKKKPSAFEEPKNKVASEKLPFYGLPEFITALPECTRMCFEEPFRVAFNATCARLSNWNCVCHVYTGIIYNQTMIDELDSEFFLCIEEACGVWKWGSERAAYYEKMLALKDHCDTMESVFDEERNKKDYREEAEARRRRLEWEREKAKKNLASTNYTGNAVTLAAAIAVAMFVFV